MFTDLAAAIIGAYVNVKHLIRIDEVKANAQRYARSA